MICAFGWSRMLIPMYHRGFAMGWQYAIGWLLTLPYEITAAGVTISYWHSYNIGIWIAVFLSTLIIVQFFGVKGYGEGEGIPRSLLDSAESPC